MAGFGAGDLCWWVSVEPEDGGEGFVDAPLLLGAQATGQIAVVRSFREYRELS